MSFYDFSFLLFRWLEKWLRRWRGVFCGHVVQSTRDAMTTLNGLCKETIRDLRRAKCAGSLGHTSVMKSLRNDLECAVFSGSPNRQSTSSYTMILLALVLSTLLSSSSTSILYFSPAALAM